MEQKKIPLRDVVLNESNPRQITDEKFNKLVESILVFHKMLELRPVVLDDNSIALGGNMRTRALNWIAKATEKQITERLFKQLKFRQKTEYEQQAIIDYWMEWKKKPVVDVCYASDLSEDERKEFVIKDNVGFGEWDSDMLANEWDAEFLDDWGLDVWQENEEPEKEPNKEPKDLSNQVTDILQVVIDCHSEEQQEELYNELTERGLVCRVLTL